MKVMLASNDRLLIVQFDLNNFEALPFRLPDKATETKQEAKQRRTRSKKNAPSTILLEKQSNVFAVYMPISLYENGYVLVDAGYQERVDRRQNNLSYHSIRYTFVRQTFERKSDRSFHEFLPWRGVHCAGMQELCELAIWGKVRIYRNQFYENGVEIPNQYAISVSLDARKPLYDSEASALTFAPDETNRPDYLLVVVRNILMLDLFS